MYVSLSLSCIALPPTSYYDGSYARVQGQVTLAKRVLLVQGYHLNSSSQVIVDHRLVES
jgi:hypothetical protein